MGVFSQHGTALEWRGGHETVRIEPWGSDSLRVRGTLWASIRDDLPGALLDVAREFKRRGLPLSVIVVDYFHWTRPGEWRFDPAEWPDPTGMVAELDRLGVKLMVSIHDGMTAEGSGEIVSLCRSAWAGSQRYGVAVWSGDVDSTFEDLRRQIPAGLNIGLSGIAWWTTDIGGFKGGDVRSPSFRELLVRWFQFGVFSPLCRLHGFRLPGTMSGAGQSGAPNEPWSFGDEVYEILRRWLHLRERLRPYIMDTMRVAHTRGLPPMRPLFLNFPADDTCWEIADQFLLGDDLLVAPVVVEGATEREVYLPAGAQWLDAWTGSVRAGGQALIAPAPLDRIPVYARAGGTIEPFGEVGFGEVGFGGVGFGEVGFGEVG
jgi:alpha-glucosidase (family GH31 glycosyl hydrolase)